MTFYTERSVKAIRKPRPCSSCGIRVERGSSALICTGNHDGFWSGTFHVDCREVEVALNALYDNYSGDDWMSLTDIEWDDWPWLIADHPTVAARMGITTERFEKVQAEHEARRGLRFMQNVQEHRND
jgi:hypothetical protein